MPTPSPGYILATHEKDGALHYAIQMDRQLILNHQFPDNIESGPGGLRQLVCEVCGRTIFVNPQGVTFGSAKREMCGELLTDEREEL